MELTSIEIKSRIDNPTSILQTLKAQGARYVGLDHQKDSYFKVDSGRLKLRQGNIENTLIRYHRPETKSLKHSFVRIQAFKEDCEALREILHESYGTIKTVRKDRHILFIENVKFHVDHVESLGHFVEIEALDTAGKRSEVELTEQCNKYIELLNLDRSKFIDKSYSDLVDNPLS
jgi:predicted adenylyl cyclase CyaB